MSERCLPVKCVTQAFDRNLDRVDHGSGVSDIDAGQPSAVGGGRPYSGSAVMMTETIAPFRINTGCIAAESAASAVPAMVCPIIVTPAAPTQGGTIRNPADRFPHVFRPRPAEYPTSSLARELCASLAPLAPFRSVTPRSDAELPTPSQYRCFHTASATSAQASEYPRRAWHICRAVIPSP